jgi:adenylate kinase
MGPPGAGKGTQGELLAGRFDIPRYSTGDILRAARRDGSELGREAQGYMDAGELVPDGVILGLISEALTSAEAERGYVLDGFPRTVAQAEGLADLLRAAGRELDAVVNLEVADEEIVQRLSSRRVCEDCGTLAATGPGGGECPSCRGNMITRVDDQPETVRRRLDVYRGQTEPVLAWYRASSVEVLDVPGIGDIEEIQGRIRGALVA